jgi:hypothetical protein
VYLTSSFFFIDLSSSYYCQSCDLWDLIFVHLFFMFSFPYFLISDNGVLFHGSIDHASTITSYVSIVMTFVTFNAMWGHISISFLKISSISPAICNLISKVSSIKTMTIKEIYILWSEWCSPFELLHWLIIILSYVDPFIMVETSLLPECGRSC